MCLRCSHISNHHFLILCGHFLLLFICLCCSVQSSEGGISLPQMVDDVALILSAESGQFCVLFTPNLNHPPFATRPSLLAVHRYQSTNYKSTKPYDKVSANIFRLAWPSLNQTTETLAAFGTKDCSEHSAYDSQQDMELGLYRLQTGKADSEACGGTYRN